MPAGLTSELGLLAARNFFKRNERVSLEKQVKSIQKKKASQKVTSDYDERQRPTNLICLIANLARASGSSPARSSRWMDCPGLFLRS